MIYTQNVVKMAVLCHEFNTGWLCPPIAEFTPEAVSYADNIRLITSDDHEEVFEDESTGNHYKVKIKFGELVPGCDAFIEGDSFTVVRVEQEQRLITFWKEI